MYQPHPSPSLPTPRRGRAPRARGARLLLLAGALAMLGLPAGGLAQDATTGTAADAAVAADAGPDPLDATREAFMAAETPEGRLEVVRTFLAEHPDHPEVPTVAGAGADVLTYQLDDRAGAIALLEEQIARSDQAVAQQRMRMRLISAYGTPDHAEELAALTAGPVDVSALPFGDQLTVLEAAEAAEAWDLLARAADLALANATATQFAADFPDREFTGEEINARGANRRGLVLTYHGRAQARRGDLAGAMTSFAAADAQLQKGFLGVPDNALYRYWGQALVAAGETEAGVRKLAVAAAFASDEQAHDLAREHYQDLGRDEDFADYLWTIRRAEGPLVPGFAARDYDGQTRQFADVRGEKASRVAFWFPT